MHLILHAANLMMLLLFGWQTGTESFQQLVMKSTLLTNQKVPVILLEENHDWNYQMCSAKCGLNINCIAYTFIKNPAESKQSCGNVGKSTCILLQTGNDTSSSQAYNPYPNHDTYIVEREYLPLNPYVETTIATPTTTISTTTKETTLTTATEPPTTTVPTPTTTTVPTNDFCQTPCNADAVADTHDGDIRVFCGENLVIVDTSNLCKVKNRLQLDSYYKGYAGKRVVAATFMTIPSSGIFKEENVRHLLIDEEGAWYFYEYDAGADRLKPVTGLSPPDSVSGMKITLISYMPDYQVIFVDESTKKFVCVKTSEFDGGTKSKRKKRSYRRNGSNNDNSQENCNNTMKILEGNSAADYMKNVKEYFSYDIASNKLIKLN